MFHGGFDIFMQMVGLARIPHDEEFNELCATQLPSGGWRHLANPIAWLRQTFHAHQPVTQVEILGLIRAHQALEARIVELERQLTAGMASQP
jgi:hypothetical protein